MHIHYLQHVPFEGIACIKDWALLHQHQLSCSRLFEEDVIFPNLNNIDLLLILGGPMGADDEDKYPWLSNEKILIKEAIDRGIKVIGICLGAQLIATVYGAKVYPGKQKEIGWFPVYATAAAKSSKHYNEILNPPPLVFHWHGDTFDLPEKAVLLAYSEAYKNQWFLIEDNIMGIQFHFEASPESIELMLENEGHELEEKAAFIQDIPTIRNLSGHCKENNKLLYHLLDFFEKA